MSDIETANSSCENTAGNLLHIANYSVETSTIDLDCLLATEVKSLDDFDLNALRLSILKRLLQEMAVPSVLVDEKYSILLANGAFQKMTRTQVGNRQSFVSLFPLFSEANRIESTLQKVFCGKKPQLGEGRFKIGKFNLWCRMHFRCIRFSKNQFVLVQIENLSAQKKLLSVQKYKKLVQMFPVGIAEFTLDAAISYKSSGEQLLEHIMTAKLIDGNDSFARTYKLPRITDLMGLSLEKLVPSRGKAKEFFEKWIAHGFSHKAFETRLRGGPQGVRHFENTWIANVNDEHLMGLWWLKRDITEKKHQEDEMLKAQKLESLGILAGGIAHDFNNLLTGILGNISLAQMHINDPEDVRKKHELALNAVRKAQALSTQLLTFSKGGEPLTTACSVSDLLKDYTSFALRGSNVCCELNIPDDIWPIQVDQSQMNQVINNLMINATQAMPQGGTIRVSASNVEIGMGSELPLAEGKYVRISISHSGNGISPENLTKIFDPYFTTKESGTGLGLATAYSVMKKHRGYIGVNSRIGLGSTFFCYIPTSQVEPRKDPSEKNHLVKGTGRVLIMDDDEGIRTLAEAILSEIGYQVITVRDGNECLKEYHAALLDNRFDVVIMDLTVPGGMGGKEAIQHLRRIDPTVKAVVSSGYSNDPIMSDYENHGFVDVLTKPYDAATLSHVLGRITASLH